MEQSESGLPDIRISIEDRQTLKLLEDSILDLKLIFPNLLGVVNGLRSEFSARNMRMPRPMGTIPEHQHLVHQFDAYSEDLKVHLQSLDVLRDKTQDTAKLVCFEKLFQTIHVNRISDRSSYPIY